MQDNTITMLTYICKYTPLELLEAFHVRAQMPNHDVEDFSRTDDQIHSNVCAHAKMLLGTLTDHPGDEVLLVNCCDSIHRVYDTIPKEPVVFQRMLDLPHKTEGFAIDLYARELQRFAQAYARYCGHSYDPAVLLASWKQNTTAWSKMMAGEAPFIAVLGARPSDPLLQKMRQSLPYPVHDLTCGGLRSLPMPPAGLEEMVRQEELARREEHAAASEDENSDRHTDSREAESSEWHVDPWKVKSSERHADSGGASASDRLLWEYAKALLSQVPCMRMSDTSGRARLLCRKGLRGIVYHSVRFCDYYSFEYAKLRRETDLPILKIESDYTSQSEGQLATRLEAYSETLHTLYKLPAERSKYKVPEQVQPVPAKSHLSPENAGLFTGNTDKEKSRSKNASTNIYIGIDSGSTTTNGVAIDGNGEMLASCVIRTGAKAAAAAQRVYDELKRQLGIAEAASRAGAEAIYEKTNLTGGSVGSNETAGSTRETAFTKTSQRTAAVFEKKTEDAASARKNAAAISAKTGSAVIIRKVVATGYGREHIPFADDVRTEISCHARGAHFSNPAARTIIDIGGQDSKIICLDEEGNVTNFVMNDKCAAGTGRFLEMMAHTLELDLDDMSKMGLSWKKDLNITSTCTVFAESEVVSLVAENNDTNDIIHALNKSVARKTASMCRRVQAKAPYMMTGGVAMNRGVVTELEKNLGAPISILAHPDLNGALGAALYARE